MPVDCWRSVHGTTVVFGLPLLSLFTATIKAPAAPRMKIKPNTVISLLLPLRRFTEGNPSLSSSVAAIFFAGAKFISSISCLFRGIRKRRLFGFHIGQIVRIITFVLVERTHCCSSLITRFTSGAIVPVVLSVPPFISNDLLITEAT